MPVMQRRLLHLVMAQAQIEGEGIAKVEMNVGDIVRALGLSDAGPRYEEVRAAVRGLMGQVLDIDTTDGWVQFHWVDVARYIKSRDSIQLRVSDELLPHVLDIKDMWRIISLGDMTQLQGKHSFRIFELVMADRGFAGKGGNRPGEWFTDLDFGDLRTLLRIKPEEYKLTTDFRKRIVDGPVREINDAGLGLRIECDYETFRRGRSLRGVRLNCKLLKAGDPRPVAPATKAEREEEDLAEKYPERYAQLLKEARAQKALPGLKLSPETDALRLLAAEVKGKKAALPKRGTKAKS
jgi:plasmid replication initiation protein